MWAVRLESIRCSNGYSMLANDFGKFKKTSELTKNTRAGYCLQKWIQIFFCWISRNKIAK
ncbi:hypothetical protein BN2476_720024 [Paraburkholderia piptadeniae]|uniref:Uncharacterized protein n=1 Tax=Paraburkholderia piptadeniae TaxID=1701573 RepID=A0A1N7SSB6_9BURK|nr:hypothetical protein BN2476_720024 [Paraburkholderia piptadeniae]